MTADIVDEAQSATTETASPNYTPAPSEEEHISDGVALHIDGAKEEERPHIEAGMECGLKNLYSGPEDKHRRFKWVDKIPDDLGKPAENAETAKWALIVRHCRVFGNPRKVLQIHSIVVQSPLLKKFLEQVLKDYPGVTTNLNRLEFSGRFEPLIHRWTQMKEAIATEEDPVTKEHAELLFSVLETEFKDVIENSTDMISKSVMTFEHLWTLFQPGSIIYSRQDGQETAMKLVSARYGEDQDGNTVYWITGQYVDWGGSKFGTNKLNIPIQAFVGTQKIHQLTVLPVEFHPQKDALRTRLIERGAKVESLCGVNYKYYVGIGWRKGQWGKKDKSTVKGRIVIDTASWNRFNPNQGVYVTSFAKSDNSNSLPRKLRLRAPPSQSLPPSENDDEDAGYGEGEYSDPIEDIVLPTDGFFPDMDDSELATKRVPLTDDQKLICTPLVRGYALSSKQWLNFFVSCVKEIEWSTTAFESLVLPDNQKELILGFTESQRKFNKTFDDVIEGKGKGINLLLMGPPGVGKTLTAEAVAEEMKVPLYMLSAGDLGLSSRSIESKLSDILEMCTKWNAILLIDEADVFLEQRSLHELERNKLVSIFLRLLEYYEGIMFLTTNRVSTFDAAFQSRIHISLDYPELNTASRRTVWKNFLSVSAAAVENTISEFELDKLSLIELNGRQIKNILKTAQLLARRKERKLNFEDIKTVLDVTMHLHNDSKETDRQRAAIFA